MKKFQLLAFLTLTMISVALWPHTAHAAGLLDPDVEECANAYYGIGEKVDYKKAYKCFASLDVWPFLIVMQVNGQGVPANVKNAHTLMEDWLKADPMNAHSMDAKTMEWLIRQRLHKKPNEYTQIDYCQEAAMTTYAMNFCAGIQDDLDKQDFDTAMHSIGSGLSGRDRALWDKIQGTFTMYERAEGKRLYQQFISGTIRGLAYSGQVSFVRSNFKTLMESAFGERALRPSSKQELHSVNNKILQAYKNDINDYVDMYESFASDREISSEQRQRYRDDIAAYKADAQKSQELWERLLDLCSKLTTLVYASAEQNTDWRASITVALSRNRILAINNKPVGLR